MAFVGRSNVGKSTLINQLIGTNDLLKCSKTPGKTHNLHFVDIPPLKLHFVDCPGYGFAVASSSEKESWK
jgi:GTP-binding protein